MGGHSRKSRDRKPTPEPSTSTASSSSATSSSDDQLESSSKLRKRRRDRDRDREEKRRSKKSRRDNERSKKKKKHSRRDREKHKRRERKNRRYDSDDESGSESNSESESPEDVVKYILKEFPTVAGDLEQLLRMIDEGQAVDIRGLSERSLVKHLRRLFISLNLKENGDKVFLLPDKASPTLDVVGPIIRSKVQPQKELDHLESQREAHSVPPVSETELVTDNVDDTKEDSVGPRKRVIGPEMPSAELLAAAAKLTEAEAELRSSA